MNTNKEVFQAFAAGRAAEGGNVKSVSNSWGFVLYSYSTPIAINEPNGVGIVFDTAKYSVTTSKQQSQARYQASYIANGYHEVEHAEFLDMCKARGVYGGRSRW